MNLEWTDNSGNMIHSYATLNHHNRPYHTVAVTLSDPKPGKILRHFKSIRDASRFIHRDASIVRRLINSNKNTKYGYKWEKSSTTIENNEDYYVIDIH